MVTDVGQLIASARRYGRLEVQGDHVVVEGRFPKALADALRANKKGIRAALLGPSPTPLVVAASDMAPSIRLTVRETFDVESDVAFLRRVRLLIEEHPGGNVVALTIRTLDGRKVRARWWALATRQLRFGLAALLREQVGRGSPQERACERPEGVGLCWKPLE